MNEKIKERETIIQLYKKNKSTYEIADLLEISQTKASFWVRRWKKTKNLENLPRSGRPTKLKGKILRSLKKALIKRLNRKAGLNSKEVLDLINKKTHKNYSLRQAQRVLHKLGFSIITPRPEHINKDPKAVEVFKEKFKKNLKRSIWTIKL